MPLWLLVTKEIVPTAGIRYPSSSSLIFYPSFAENHTLHDTKEPMKLFLVHTMLFVGCIWKNKSG
jgi:hypothetical protein